MPFPDSVIKGLGDPLETSPMLAVRNYIIRLKAAYHKLFCLS